MNTITTNAGEFDKEINLIQATATRTKGQIVRIGSSSAGLVDVTIADDTNVYKVGVVGQDATSGTKYPLIVKGQVTCTVPSGTYVAGDGVDILDGAVRPSTTTAEKPNGVTTNNDFGVVITGGVGVTEIVIYLYGEAVTAQT